MPRLLPLVEAQANQKDHLLRTVIAQALRLLRSDPNLRDPRTVDRLVKQWVKISAAGQQKSAALTDAYLSRVLSEIEGHAVTPRGVTVAPAQLRGGVDPVEVFERVAKQARFAESQGAPGLPAAEGRLRLIISDDLHLAEREAQHRVLQQKRITGYRRIIHPELSRGGVCGLCLAASDRTYHTEALLPIHARCKCTVLPIVRGADPGDDVTAATFKQLYRLAGGTDGAKLKRVRFTVHEHGELGPVLRHAHHDFRGPGDIPDAA